MQLISSGLSGISSICGGISNPVAGSVVTILLPSESFTFSSASEMPIYLTALSITNVSLFINSPSTATV